ncbi:MAG: hypothetical protein J6Q14_03750 [Oscillospiraceae bacterium]|nr:hypothetical protein [Oscillospiraceae bacterium]
MKDHLYYRCQRGKQTYEATIYRYNGRWNLVIELVVGDQCFEEFERYNCRSLLSAKLAMYTYFPYGTVKWNRIR